MPGPSPQGSPQHGAPSRIASGENTPTDDVKREPEMVTMESLQKMMMLQLQVMQAQTQAQAQQVQSTQNPHSGPALTMRNTKVPEGRYDMSSAEYRSFVKDVEDYKTLTQLTDAQIVLQLRLNMDPILKAAVDTNFHDAWNGYTVKEAIKAVGTVVKKASNPVVARTEFNQMKQKSHESVQEFVTRLKACALECDFLCPFDDHHDLTEYHLINQIRCGIHDVNLQKELLQKHIDLRTLELIVQFCQTHEAAKSDQAKLSDASVSANYELSNDELVSAISEYRRKKRNRSNSTQHEQVCGSCGYEKHNGNKCPAQGQICKHCKKLNHFERVCRSKKSTKESAKHAAIISSIEIAISASTVSQLPYLNVAIQLESQKAATSIGVVADTGAMVSVAGPKQIEALGITINDLKKPAIELRNASNGNMTILGSHNVSVYHNDECSNVIMYFAAGVKHMYLSLDCCKELKIVGNKFPHDKIVSTSATVQSHDIELPFEPIEENVQKLEDWLRERFSETTFNTSGDLPMMSGPPQKIHLKEGAIPYAVSTPIPIPHNWKKEVKAQLDDDEKRKVIQKVPVGEPTEWCMRMVVAKRKDGGPRRTIDFQPINKLCARETHHTPSPFEVVSNIPKHSYKTVMDAFNGYHQVELDVESRKLTTFITEYGRYQYLRTPQGHMSSRDAYTRRYDDIISDVPRKHKVVDDVLLHDVSIKDAFYHTYDYLILCEQNGVTLQPKKFMFARREVEFVGYQINWEDYRPSDNTLSAIQNFPMPESPSITDVRAWFGLVNQVAPFILKSDWMAPFRDLLKVTDSKSKRVYWDDNLQQIFTKSRDELVKVATQGLNYYDASLRTALVTDWSKTGIGFLVVQKHCKCTENSILCCSGGWKLVYCNDRFLDKAEINYAPIEGESLSISWALRKARMFLLGCKDFIIVVDHEPLLKVFGDKSLDKIDNPRLRSYKEKTMEYSFKMQYIKGVKNQAADAFSRYPTSKPDREDIEESLLINAIHSAELHANQEAAASIDIEDIRVAGKVDQEYLLLLEKISTASFCKTAHLESTETRDFFNVRDRLGITDGLITYSFEAGPPRLVIPKSLRQQVIINLHAANQGSTAMTARARSCVYWPGMDRDITAHVKSCALCRVNAPSKPDEPAILTDAPKYPFQQVASDLFEIEGTYFLTYVDRLTGFPELAHFQSGTSSSNIIGIIREFFHRWGVPEEISLDGAPNLSSSEIVEWLKKWKVSIRLSSAYFPQSNGRAEAAVKSMKRLLKGKLGRGGSLKTDAVAEGLLQYRNTPLRNVNKSPAELALGRSIRDTIPLPQERYKINKQWYYNLRERERCMAKANELLAAKQQNKKSLKLLSVGDEVLCQNTRTLKWDRAGVIVELRKFRQYAVRMEGSGRISLRNRKHLQQIVRADVPPTQVTKGRMDDDTDNKTPLSMTKKASSPMRTTEMKMNHSPAVANDASCGDQVLPEPSLAESQPTWRPKDVLVRRSTRATRRPVRYEDEFPCNR